MNIRRVKKFVLTIALLSSLPVAALAQQEEARGELQIYERATQIGTTASRVFRDAKGRIVKTIYYTGGGLQSPSNEESLREQSVRVTTYDEYDCPSKTETYEPGMKLAHTLETICREGTATPRNSIIRDARGVKLSETRHNDGGGTHVSLYFDDEGERVTSIWGKTPDDVDLADGWGKEAAGFASGIAASSERARQTELRVWVTIKNTGHRREGELMMVSLVAFELTDAAGLLVAPKAGTVETFDEGAGCPMGEARGAPRAGASELLRSYKLDELYEHLPPGAYSLTVKHCLSPKRRLIVSNTIHFEVVQ